ncbi:hypothetical protein Achl_0948 [Pseudarthrobacter chlorophenolicus A6]|uniref:Uncharacterized protein n=1 Tax=Pseudarthrobacter chlorophenolicus (strain ATCC 700700 / DSM 12829 / CIP 107037 / JCM 12360 / KCTC 9906 / NCIMB 13794 / A6) TaxID=452863 RepID=B8HDD8_PSECP|nr:hypothetical protein [Pseudarthrobacter chlorophenolicus]ACL38943.1 hypothetical protein Achl_0948 [Pseudarthrobacter chlorophenolicus A6]SDR06580.1 hypothetical protein SAMN04489738_4581 [Pseudarthrobacter chlorophenolicus]
MSRNQHNVEVFRDEIIAVAAELRAVARSEQDKQRIEVADWLDEQFIGISDPRVLREATRNALTLFQGGMGSFQDVGTEASAHAVSRLRSALVRGLDTGVRDS